MPGKGEGQQDGEETGGGMKEGGAQDTRGTGVGKTSKIQRENGTIEQ